MEATINHLNLKLEEKIFRKGENLYQAGTLAHGFFWIKSGTVKIYNATHGSREFILRLAADNDILGHCFLYGHTSHPDSARALELTRCYYFDQKSMDTLISKNPELGMLLLKKIGEELTLVRNKCLDMVKKNVRERLASYFHYMALSHSTRDQHGFRINVHLRREEIASIIGTANETAIRFISEFKELGLIQEKEKYFHVLDPKRLAEIGRLSGDHLQ